MLHFGIKCVLIRDGYKDLCVASGNFSLGVSNMLEYFKGDAVKSFPQILSKALFSMVFMVSN